MRKESFRLHEERPDVLRIVRKDVYQIKEGMMLDITPLVLLLLLVGPVFIDYLRGKVVWDPNQKMFVEKENSAADTAERHEKPCHYYYNKSWKELQDGRKGNYSTAQRGNSADAAGQYREDQLQRESEVYCQKRKSG
ncbi:MAG: hypothetical protein ACOCTM_04740 [Bacteroidota bacterium]